MKKPAMMKMLMVGGIAVSLFACDANNDTGTAMIAGKNTLEAPVDSGVVLAQVDGTQITDKQVKYAIKKTVGRNLVGPGLVGQSADRRFNKELEKKILDSLVSSRAMAIAYEKTMDAKEKQEITIMTDAYREELLVKRYLRATIEPEAVSTDLVKSYYNEHLTDFGAITVKEYELLRTETVVDDSQRKRVIAEYEKARNNKDWKAVAEKMTKTALKIEYSKSAGNPNLLIRDLQRLVEKTKVGETSGVGFYKGKIAIVRVIGEKQLAAKPLNEVSKMIREKLAPLQVKKAVKEASTIALGKVTVNYTQQ